MNSASTYLKQSLTNVDVINVARFIFLMNIVAMTRAFALVSLLEFLLLLLFCSSSLLRERLVERLKFDLPVQLSLVWLLWVIVATFWGDAQLSEKWSEVWSWRKIYLLILV